MIGLHEISLEASKQITFPSEVVTTIGLKFLMINKCSK